MAVYKLFPQADTTLYSGYPEKNTGIDEILEASTNFLVNNPPIPGTYPQTSRFILQFNSEELSTVFQTLISSSNWKAVFKCFNAEAYGLSDTTQILINPVAQNWSMGTGKFTSEPQLENGAAWIQRDYSGGSNWYTGSYPAGITGSYNLTTNPQSVGGGTWYITPQHSQSYTYYSPLDIEVDLTQTVQQWVSSSIPNYGIIVRQNKDEEFIANVNVQRTLKYFSRDTHTIYVPQLELRWDDSTYTTGSLEILNQTPASITVTNNNGQYYGDSVNIFRLGARPLYPVKTWSTASVYTKNYALPENTVYAIQDLDTRELIIDFDDTYTKVSCDSTGSFFKIYMGGLEPERDYKILIKTQIQNSTLVIDPESIFKVVNP